MAYLLAPEMRHWRVTIQIRTIYRTVTTYMSQPRAWENMPD